MVVNTDLPSHHKWVIWMTFHLGDEGFVCYTKRPYPKELRLAEDIHHFLKEIVR